MYTRLPGPFIQRPLDIGPPRGMRLRGRGFVGNGPSWVNYQTGVRDGASSGAAIACSIMGFRSGSMDGKVSRVTSRERMGVLDKNVRK